VVGQTLETARKKAGLTQQEVAKALKKPQSFVSAYESGQRRVDLLELAAIAAAIQASPHKLAKAILDQL
jgi:transcriptional regulator with XRE-family HTH domain